MSGCLQVDFLELVLKVCEVLIDDTVTEVNVILLKVYDVDVILEMGWFNHQASVDCFTKKIMFKKPGYLEVEFEGDRRILATCVISTLETKILLHKNCEAYLTYMIDKSSSKITLGGVPEVHESLNVYVEDLSSLPLDRELEFGIELLSSSTLISIPPYRMAPAELKELKTQL